MELAERDERDLHRHGDSSIDHNGDEQMNALVEAARRYIGQKEMTNNRFSDQTEIGKKLHAAGQQDGQAWCAYFVEACLKDAYPEKFEEWYKLCNASAVKTFNNLIGAAYPHGEVPREGWIVAWQSYKDGVAGWTGHIGIVSSVNLKENTFLSIEGNTNAGGSREGVEVAERPHRVSYDTKTGLRLLGFIQVS